MIPYETIAIKFLYVNRYIYISKLSLRYFGAIADFKTDDRTTYKITMPENTIIIL